MRTTMFAGFFVTAALATSALASTGSQDEGVVTEDLVLDGARWLAEANGYICGENQDLLQQAPQSLEDLDIVFETAVTDYSLDNGLIKASFIEEGVVCRYSALLFADNAARTIDLVESRSYAVDGSQTCSQGKALLDGYFEANEYLYWGRPHHLTVMIPVPDAPMLCGKGATHVGVDFILKGRIQ